MPLNDKDWKQHVDICSFYNAWTHFLSFWHYSNLTLQSYTQILWILNVFAHAYTIHTMTSILKIAVKPLCFKEDVMYFLERLYTAALEQGDC